MEGENLLELEPEENPLPQPARWRRIFRPAHLLWLLVPVFLWGSLRSVRFQDIQTSLQRLVGWQLGVLLLFNALIFLLFGARWWLIIRSFGKQVPLLAVTVYRLASFGFSYFTPGPQIGGEAMQVVLLTRKHAMAAPQAISSVVLDKLIELLSNFTFMVFGIAVILASHLVVGWLQSWIWPLLAVILAFPAFHLAALWWGRQPLTRLLRSVRFGWPENDFFEKVYTTVQQAEMQIGSFCRDKAGVLGLAILLSCVIWAALIGEYILLVRFLGIQLSPVQTVIALTLSRIAFLMPLPGGLGALEASQVWSMQVFGLDPALGITLSLVIRARDIISGGVGLALGGWHSRQ
jgi:glycosyltransferase 2 family protein